MPKKRGYGGTRLRHQIGTGKRKMINAVSNVLAFPAKHQAKLASDRADAEVSSLKIAREKGLKGTMEHKIAGYHRDVIKRGNYLGRSLLGAVKEKKRSKGDSVANFGPFKYLKKGK